MNVRLIVKAALFTLLIPGVVTILVPYLILGTSVIEPWSRLSTVRIFATFIGVIVAAILLHCIWGFAYYGKGTLAPFNPPEILVIRGLYRFTRNPMYLGVVSVLAAESLFFENSVLLVYTAIMFSGFHLFVLLYEEPHLKNQFGKQYLDYRRVVPRWGVARHPFNSVSGPT